MLSRLPRLLGVYPVVSSNPQLREFANTWRSYGSVKQLQVAIATYVHKFINVFLYNHSPHPDYHGSVGSHFD